MGTNFYWSPPGGGDPLHIGKRSGAGGGLCSFGLQGHREGVDGPINSWAKWRQCLLLPEGEVFDEYGRGHTPAEFVAEVESTTVENRRRQYDWLRDREEPWFGGVIPEGVAPPLDTTDEWLCPDGFSFTYREFS